MSSFNEFLYIGFGFLGYFIPTLSFLMSLLAVYYKSVINGCTKYFVVICLLSVAYLSMHHGYMTSELKLPLPTEFEWRGFHLLVFAVFYAFCLHSAQNSKPVALKTMSVKKVK